MFSPRPENINLLIIYISKQIMPRTYRIYIKSHHSKIYYLLDVIKISELN